MSISNDQTSQEHKLNKANPSSRPTIEEEAEQAKSWADARTTTAEQAKIEIKARIADVNKHLKDVSDTFNSYCSELSIQNMEQYTTGFRKYCSDTYNSIATTSSFSNFNHRWRQGDRAIQIPMYFFWILKATVAELARAEEARVAAEEQAKLYKALYDRLAVMEHKLDQMPIMSNVVKHQGNTIDAGIDETKRLRGEIYELSDRLDSCERMNKFICYVFDPADLQGKAKEMYGLICPKVGHDEL